MSDSQKELMIEVEGFWFISMRIGILPEDVRAVAPSVVMTAAAFAAPIIAEVGDVLVKINPEDSAEQFVASYLKNESQLRRIHEGRRTPEERAYKPTKPPIEL